MPRTFTARRDSVDVKNPSNVVPFATSQTRRIDAHILRLADELLVTILNYLDGPRESVAFDRRAYLSVESFAPPERLSPTRVQDLGSFRRTCRRFAKVGIVAQFQKVSIRFSNQDLDRLDHIASSPHLACQVKRFSYLVPYFYVDGKYTCVMISGSANTAHIQDETTSNKYFLASWRAREDWM